jgi:hypothetical protein
LAQRRDGIPVANWMTAGGPFRSLVLCGSAAFVPEAGDRQRDLATHRALCSSSPALTFTVRDVTTLILAFGQERVFPSGPLWRDHEVSL